MLDSMVQKWQSKKACIAVIGLGYVGLPLALSFVKAGIEVIGIDKDDKKIASIKKGKSYLQHIADEQIANNSFTISSDSSKVGKADGIIICVPTPLTASLEPDLSFISSSMQDILPYLRKGQVLALESTTYPGTTEEEIAPLLQGKNFDLGKDFFLVYSPEREDPGNENFSTTTIPKIIGGYSDNCCKVGVAMYETAIEKMVVVRDTRTAEMVKLLENIYRSVNIGLVNEMKKVSERMGIDIYEVIRAASSKPFGFKAFYPGPGVGGHCIPVDPFYLTWKARAYGLHTHFIELAGEINKSMPEYVVGVLSSALNDFKKSVKGSKILIFGVSYKRNIGDLREAPSLDIIRLLRDQGAELFYSDPYVAELQEFNLSHRDCDEAAIAEADAVIIVSDHDIFDYDMLERAACLIVDTRGRLEACAGRIIRA